MPKETSCGAIIFLVEGGKRKYLLLLYGSDHWDFVKGNIEKGESEKDTIIRETKEETGIEDLELTYGFREVMNYFYRHEGKTIFKEVIFFIAETKTKEVELSFEHKGYRWLEYEDALKQLTFDNAKKLLKKANKFLNKI